MRILSGGYSRTFLAALIVFFISIATVMGPTPPGTGVMKPAFCLTPGDRQKRYDLTDTWDTEDVCVGKAIMITVQPYLQNPHLQLVCSFRWLGPALCLCQHQSPLLPLWSCLQLWGLESLMFSRHVQSDNRKKSSPLDLKGQFVKYGQNLKVRLKT